MPSKRSAAICAALAVALTLVSCSDDDSTGEPSSTVPSSTETASTTPTLAPEPTPTPPPSNATPPPLREIRGLLTEPREIRSDVTRDVPPTTFDYPEWNRSSAVIYDIAKKTTIDLGPGSNVEWAPDSRRGVWIAYPPGESQFGNNGRATLIDVRDGSRRDLGPARLTFFLDNDKVVVVAPGGNDSLILDLRTGATTSVLGVPARQPNRTTPYYIEVVEGPTGSLRFGGNEEKTFELRETATDFVLYHFTAYAAVLADARTLVVATPPAGGLQDLRTNLFEVDIATGQATYVATALASPDNWPFRASSRWIAWTDAYCIYDEAANQPVGVLRLFDRTIGKITELRNPASASGTFGPWFDLTSAGLLQIGTFSGGRLLDPDTLQYRAAISGIHVNWTDDYAYAAQGQFGGHGGLCAG